MRGRQADADLVFRTVSLDHNAPHFLFEGSRAMKKRHKILYTTIRTESSRRLRGLRYMLRSWLNATHSKTINYLAFTKETQYFKFNKFVLSSALYRVHGEVERWKCG